MIVTKARIKSEKGNSRPIEGIPAAVPTNRGAFGATRSAVSTPIPTNKKDGN